MGDHMDELTFQDNFWGEENSGFAVLLNRLKYGRCSTEALLGFLSARIEIEEDYVRKLQKLSNFTFPREEEFHGIKCQDHEANKASPEEVAGALRQLSLQTGELCSRHTTLVESLKQRLLWPLEHSLKEQTVIKKQHKQEMVRILKSKNSAQESVVKLKDRYYTRCKERALLVDADVAGLKGRALEKHEQKLKRAKEAEQEADSEYRSAAYRLSELHNQWQGRMAVSLQEFQKLEETRLELVKQILMEYSAINHFHMRDQAVAYAALQERAAQCDRVLEIEGFVRKYGTGRDIPMAPAYINFPLETIEDSLRRLSLRPTQSPRKLYASSSSSLSSTDISIPSFKPSIGTGMGGLARMTSSPLYCGESVRSPSVAGSVRSGGDRRPRSPPAEVRRGSMASGESSPASFSDRSSPTPSLNLGSSPGPRPTIRKMRATQSYDGSQNGSELSYKRGQIIEIVAANGHVPWYVGRTENGGKEGMISREHLEDVA